MKHQITWQLVGSVLIAAIVSATLGYYAGYKSSYDIEEWHPKVGDEVATVLQPDGKVGELRNVTITKVVRVGMRSQTGLLVYGDGLPGVDSSWVKPTSVHLNAEPVKTKSDPMTFLLLDGNTPAMAFDLEVLKNDTGQPMGVVDIFNILTEHTNVGYIHLGLRSQIISNANAFECRTGKFSFGP